MADGSPVGTDTFQAGWSPSLLYRDAAFSLLELTHPEQGTAFWYFDEKGKFVGNSATSIYPELSEQYHRLMVGLVQSLVQPSPEQRTGAAAGAFGLMVGLIQSLAQSSPEQKAGGVAGAFGLMSSEMRKEIASAVQNYLRVSPPAPIDFEQAPAIKSYLSLAGRSIQDNIVREKRIAVPARNGKDLLDLRLVIPLTDFIFVYLFVDPDEGVVAVKWDYHYSHPVLFYYFRSNTYFSLREPEYVRRSVVDLFAGIGKYFNQLLLYSPSTGTGEGITVFHRDNHIGHRLYNELGGLYRLAKQGLAGNVRDIVMLGGDNIDVYGPFSELMPAFSPHPVSYVESIEEFAEFIFKSNAVPIRVTDEHVATGLSQSIIEYALRDQANLTQDLKDRLAEPKSDHNKLQVLIGLRVEDRTWLNQHVGIVEIIDYLLTKTDQLLIVLDGHNMGRSRRVTSFMESDNDGYVDQEWTIARFVEAAFEEQIRSGRLRLVNCIMRSVQESVLWAYTSDFFIAPWGAGLAKYKWAANAQGVVFSSEWNLRKKVDWNIYQSPQFREDPIEDFYVDPKYTIYERGFRELWTETANERTNFFLDVRGLRETCDVALQAVLRAKSERASE